MFVTLAPVEIGGSGSGTDARQIPPATETNDPDCRNTMVVVGANGKVAVVCENADGGIVINERAVLGDRSSRCGVVADACMIYCSGE
jgi:hypothetical protein